MKLKRGDVVVCALQGDYGKPRPALVVQSDLFNENHASVTVCPITSHSIAAPLFRVDIKASALNGLQENSQGMVDKITSVPREKIAQRIGALSESEMTSVIDALKLWMQL